MLHLKMGNIKSGRELFLHSHLIRSGGKENTSNSKLPSLPHFARLQALRSALRPKRRDWNIKLSLGRRSGLISSSLFLGSRANFECIKKPNFRGLLNYYSASTDSIYSVDHYLVSMCTNTHIVMFSAYMCTCMARTNSNTNHH